MSDDIERILIVDDNEVNREVLNDNVEMLGYETVLVEGGLQALEAVEINPPDLILLDVMMPGMDGYQVLKKLKSDPKTYNIPIIMVSALDELDIVANCIQLGAEDYLFKPFNPTILHARVQSSLDKKRLHDMEMDYRRQMEDYSQRLEEEVKKKTEDLRALNESLVLLDQSKNDFLALISHELRAPLYGLLGSADMLFDDSINDATRREYRNIFDEACGRIEQILDHAQLLTEIQIDSESFSIAPVWLDVLIQDAIASISDTISERNMHIIQPENPPNILVLGQKTLLSKAFSLLMESAVFLGAPGKPIQVDSRLDDHGAVITIKTFGRTLPEELLDKFFTVMAIVKPLIPRGDMGLGQVLAERIIRLFGGSVIIENTDDGGIMFTCSLVRSAVLTDDA